MQLLLLACASPEVSPLASNPVDADAPVEQFTLPTESGELASVEVFTDDADAFEAWQADRGNRLARYADVLARLLAGDELADAEIRAVEDQALGEGLAHTVVTGPDGEIWAVLSGVPIALAPAVDFAPVADALGARDCQPVAVPGDGVAAACQEETLPALWATDADQVPVDLVLEAASAPPDTGAGAPPPASPSVEFPVDTSKSWYHYGGSSYHYPSGGIANADDTYALDINLKTGSDCGEDVYAVASGTVKQVSSAYGWVLIEHTGSLTWLGQSYSTYYTGYLHMNSLAVSVGDSVTKGSTRIGDVYNTATSGCHLHFAFYVGTYVSSSYNGMLMSVDPDTFGGDFANFDYSGNGYVYDTYVDDYRSSGSYAFSKSGSSGWSETTSYGALTHLYHTKNTYTSNKATWTWSDGVPKTSSSWRMYVFVPRNYATTRSAKYYVYGGSSGSTSKGSATVNQNSYSDDWVRWGGSSVSFTSGDTTKVTMSANTGESSTYYVGFDMIRRVLKSDANMDQ